MMPPPGALYPAIPLTWTNYPANFYYTSPMGLQPNPNNPMMDDRFTMQPRSFPINYSRYDNNALPPNHTDPSGDRNKVKFNSSGFSRSGLQNRRFSASLSSEIYAMAKPNGDGNVQKNPGTITTDENTQTFEENIDSVSSQPNNQAENLNFELRKPLYASRFTNDDFEKPISQSNQMPKIQSYPNTRRISLTHSTIPEVDNNPFRGIHSKSMDDFSPDVAEILQNFKKEGLLADENTALTKSELDLMESLNKPDATKKTENVEDRASRILGFHQAPSLQTISSQSSKEDVRKNEFDRGSNSSINGALNGNVITTTSAPTKPNPASNFSKTSTKEKIKPAALNVEALLAFTGNHPKYNSRSRSKSPKNKQRLHSPPPFNHDSEEATSFKTNDSSAFNFENGKASKTEEKVS